MTAHNYAQSIVAQHVKELAQLLQHQQAYARACGVYTIRLLIDGHPSNQTKFGKEPGVTTELARVACRDSDETVCEAVFAILEQLDPVHHGRTVKDLMDIESDKAAGVTAQIVNDNLQHFVGTILGPKDTPYEGGVFKVDIKLTAKYPFNAPKMSFITRVWHPNVSQSGMIDLDILKDNWHPLLRIKRTLLCLSAHLAAPQPDVGPMDNCSEAATVMCRTDREAFDKMAKDWTEFFAMGDGDTNAEKVQRIVEMGFDEIAAVSALQVTGKDENAALELLLAA